MTKVKVAGLAGILVLLAASLWGCCNTGSLQVNLSPPAAVDAGAQWAVDAGARQNQRRNRLQSLQGNPFRGIQGYARLDRARTARRTDNGK